MKLDFYSDKISTTAQKTSLIISICLYLLGLLIWFMGDQRERGWSQLIGLGCSIIALAVMTIALVESRFENKLINRISAAMYLLFAVLWWLYYIQWLRL